MLAGLALGAVFLWLALRDDRAAQALQALRNARPGWLLVTFVCGVGFTMTKALRWAPLVNQVARVPAGLVLRAIWAGTAVNLLIAHAGEVSGVVGENLRKALPWLPTGRVGHVQLADAPDRHEPGTGEIHWPHVLAELDAVAQACAWHGWVGCEYHPADPSPGGTSRGLGWLTPWR